MSEDINRDVAKLTYENAGREISQAFDILNVNFTLAAGTLAALLTVIAAGELFKVPSPVVIIGGHDAKLHAPGAPTLYGFPRLSDISVLLIAGAIPLLTRFFIRATIGYQQLLRFNDVQKTMWRYLTGDLGWTLAKAHVDVYVTEWRSPARMRTILHGSFQYGWAMISFIAIGAFAWALVTAPGTTPRITGAAVVLIGLSLESLTLPRGSRFKLPTAHELARLTPP